MSYGVTQEQAQKLVVEQINKSIDEENEKYGKSEPRVTLDSIDFVAENITHLNWFIACCDVENITIGAILYIGAVAFGAVDKILADLICENDRDYFKVEKEFVEAMKNFQLDN